MADTLNKITTIIASKLKREQDEPFKRMLAVEVDQWRATLVARSLEKHPDQRNFFTQTIWAAMECYYPIPCNTAITLCNVMKSKAHIPDPMRFGTTLFDYVGGIDGKTPFRIATVGTKDSLRSDKWTSKKTLYEYTNKAILIDNQVYNFAEKPIPMIRIDAVFDSPLEAFKFNCANGGNCDFWDTPYPSTKDINQMIIQYVLQINYGMKLDKDISVQQDVEVDPTAPKNPR